MTSDSFGNGTEGCLVGRDDLMEEGISRLVVEHEAR